MPQNRDLQLLDQIDQMLLVGFRGTEVHKNSNIARVLRETNLGGVILFDYDVPSKSFPRNILNPAQTKTLIKNLQSLAKTPLFIAVDAEGGQINRLKKKYGFIEIPSAKKIGEKPSFYGNTIYKKLAGQLSELGINFNLGPVVDLDLNPKNPIIGSLERSYSPSPHTVTAHALSFIEAHNEKSIITALKHFPGHGSSRYDSHMDMADITLTHQEEELIPYEKIISKNKANAIMTAHIMNKNADPDYPATLSSFFLQKILRHKLRFQGVIISDDMQMGAIVKNYGFSEAIIKAINAGCNIIVLSNNGQVYSEKIVYDAREIILKAIKTGRIPPQRIEESFQKIIRLKQKFHILPIHPEPLA